MDALLRRRMMGAGTPPGVVFYDKLIFDGTAYIDTDIVPQDNVSYRVQLGDETQKVTQRLFMLRAGTNGLIGTLLNASTDATGRQFSIYYGSSTYADNTRRLNWTYPRYGFFLTPKRFGIGGSSYTITKGADAPTGTLGLGINVSHTGQAYTGSMSIFRIYGSEAQDVDTYAGFNAYQSIVTLRPCTYYGEAGMWYVEGNKFFGNTAGAGTLSVANNS